MQGKSLRRSVDWTDLVPLVVVSVMAGCGGNDTGGEPDPGMIDLGSEDVVVAEDLSPGDSGSPEVSVAEDVAQDATPEVLTDAVEIPQCTPFWLESKPTGPSTLIPPPDSGVNRWERAAFDEAVGLIVGQPVIHTVSTYLHEEGCYLVQSKDGFVKFEREVGPDGFTYPVLESGGEPVFKATDPTLFSTLDDELAAGANPLDSAYPDFGYPAGDPRLSFIESDQHSYPYPFERIAQLFDSPIAPDLHYGFEPSARPGLGNHGNLDVLQSRATLIFSGAGVKVGHVSHDLARLVDVAPTVLALLGASPTPGIDATGRQADNLLLARQDGRVLSDVMVEQCGGARHALIVLFDGLNPNEILHQVQSANPDLPNFRKMVQQGTVVRYGAITGYPSASGPGHLTVGTGLWGGHHGIVNNGMYRREDGFVFSYKEVVDSITEYLGDPNALRELVESFMAPGIETIFQAVHRSFGDWDPDSGTGAYVASINEMTFQGADYTVLDLLPDTVGDRFDYTALDELGVLQLQTLFDDPAIPVPKLTFLSFFATDQIGEAGGPHGDLLRDWLVTVDVHLGTLLGLYEAAGVLEDTVVVLTSDHGMETQDPDRYKSWKKPLKDAGIKYKDPDGSAFLYFKSLHVAVDGPDLVAGREAPLSVTVTNEDTGLPIVNAKVQVVGSEAPAVTTDESGMALVTLTPGAAGALTIQASHSNFNPARVELTVLDAI